MWVREYYLSVCVCVRVCARTASTQPFVYGIMCGNILCIFVCVCVRVQSCSLSLTRCVRVCVCVRERHALCTLTTSQCVSGRDGHCCVSSSEESFAFICLVLIGGGEEGRLDPCSRRKKKMWFCETEKVFFFQKGLSPIRREVEVWKGSWRLILKRLNRRSPPFSF